MLRTSDFWLVLQVQTGFGGQGAHLSRETRADLGKKPVCLYGLVRPAMNPYTVPDGTEARAQWSSRLSQPREITQLLQLASCGDAHASDALFRSVYHELQNIARAHRRRWRGNETLNTTALIHEAYLKLAGGTIADYKSRSHFFATASKAMRQVLMNYAGRMSAEKRGGDAIRVTLSGHMPVTDDTLDELLTMNEVLLKLEESNPRHARLFECRVFGGMTIVETAEALDVSPATVKRDWALLSAWVYREMSRE